MGKESFKFLLKAIQKGPPALTLIDIGCGNGEFLRYVKKHRNGLLLTGMDVSIQALKDSKRRKTPALLKQGSILDGGYLTRTTYDIVTMTGVHSEFPAVDFWLPNLLTFGHPHTIYYVMGYFNPYPIDVQTNWRMSGKLSQSRGFNIPSCRTVLKELTSRGFHGTFKEFIMRSDIPKQSDPTRVWTFKDESGKRLQTNGVCQLIPFKLLTIRKL